VNPDTVVSTLIQDLVDPDGRGLDPAHLAGAVLDMKSRLAGMPRYMGAGMVGLTVLFARVGYASAPREARLARLERWRRGPVSLQRDFVEFWEKMGTFTYYSRVEKATLGAHGGPS
jgi:hypothetical protein